MRVTVDYVSDLPEPSKPGPKPTKGITAAVRQAAMLMATDRRRWGRWALVRADGEPLGVAASNAVAMAVRNGRLLPGRWEATRRGHDLYLRFLGIEGAPDA